MNKAKYKVNQTNRFKSKKITQKMWNKTKFRGKITKILFDEFCSNLEIKQNKLKNPQLIKQHIKSIRQIVSEVKLLVVKIQ